MTSPWSPPWSAAGPEEIVIRSAFGSMTEVDSVLPADPVAPSSTRHGFYRAVSASPNLDTAPARQGSAPAGKTERTESPYPLILRPPIPETRRPGQAERAVVLLPVIM